jgi:hypothetical protein
LTVTAFIFSSSAQTPLLSSYPTAIAVIYLDFDGHTVEGTSWNWSLPAIECKASGLDSAQITEVFNRVAEDFRPFNVNVTTDSANFLAAPSDRRMRVIITTTSEWYGNSAGGVAFISSFRGVMTNLVLYSQHRWDTIPRKFLKRQRTKQVTRWVFITRPNMTSTVIN